MAEHSSAGSQPLSDSLIITTSDGEAAAVAVPIGDTDSSGGPSIAASSNATAQCQPGAGPPVTAGGEAIAESGQTIAELWPNREGHGGESELGATFPPVAQPLTLPQYVPMQFPSISAMHCSDAGN